MSELSAQLHQLLRLVLRSENRDPWNPPAHHRHFIAAVQPRAILAVLEDFVRQLCLVLNGPESVLEKEIWNARKQADRLDAVLLRLFDQRARMRPPAPCPFASGFTTIERTSHRCGP